MRKQWISIVTLAVLVGATFASGQRTPRPAAGSSNTSSNAAATKIGTSQPQFSLPPGWGLVTSPYGNINHPGGVVPSLLPQFINPLAASAKPQAGQLSLQRKYHQTGTVIVPYVVPYPVEQPVYLLPTPPDQPPVEVPAEQPVYTPPGLSVWGGNRPPVEIRELAPPEPDTPLTLIAFKDHSVYAVSDYWVEDGRLFYITNYGAKNSVAVDHLDLDVTAKLNDGRGTALDLNRKPTPDTP